MVYKSLFLENLCDKEKILPAYIIEEREKRKNKYDPVPLGLPLENPEYEPQKEKKKKHKTEIDPNEEDPSLVDFTV
ncbi:MAG: hypothetical protein ABIB71_02885 [Candidatus Woesearchaeota archaeon]